MLLNLRFTKIIKLLSIGSICLLHIQSLTALSERPYSDLDIMRAARCGNIETLKKLCCHDCNMQDKQGYSPLMHTIMASTYDTNAAAEFLLNNGANPGLQAYDGTTPLQLAMDFEKSFIAKKIFQHLTSKDADLQKYPASIAFLIADIKFDQENNLRILEFGEGTLSYFKGHDALYPKGTIWKNFWHHLNTKNIPIWHVGNLTTAKKEALEIGLKDLKTLGGTQYSSLHILEKELFFKKTIAAARNAQKKVAGIIVLHHHTTTPAMLNYFRNTYPEIIIVNEAARIFVGSKFMTNLLFEDDPVISNLRPACKIYPKEYSPSLATTIQNDFAQNDLLVIKPINSANGWGVIITHKKNLKKELKTILKKTVKLENSFDTSYTYWLADQNKHFIVEAYVPSKSIKVKGRTYDATMRQVFMVESNNSSINTIFLGSYWKLPSLSLEERGSQTERHKSNVKQGRISSAIISSEDNTIAQRILSSAIPILYKKMLQCTYQETESFA